MRVPDGMVTIFDIKRFALHDGPGIRTTVFLKGCPLHCWWCHNPESQAPGPVTVEMIRQVDGHGVRASKTYGESLPEEEVIRRVLRDRPFYEESGGGVTFSGGEPLMQPDPLEKMLKSCRGNSIQTAVDTCGYAKRKVLERMIPHTDLFLYDLKIMDAGMHKKYTGGDLSLILSNADFLLEKDAALILRIPVIPGINTGHDEQERMAGFIAQRSERLAGIHLLPYHRIAENKYSRLKMKNMLTETPEPGAAMMQELKKQYEELSGLQVLIGG